MAEHLDEPREERGGDGDQLRGGAVHGQVPGQLRARLHELGRGVGAEEAVKGRLQRAGEAARCCDRAAERLRRLDSHAGVGGGALAAARRGAEHEAREHIERLAAVHLRRCGADAVPMHACMHMHMHMHVHMWCASAHGHAHAHLLLLEPLELDVSVERHLAVGIAARDDPVGQHLRWREERAGADCAAEQPQHGELLGGEQLAAHLVVDSR